jgi:peroxiredoxin
MTAWAKDQGVEIYGENSDGFVTFLADADGSFTKACDMEMVHPGPLGVGIIGRCKRWAFFAEKGEVKVVNVSEYEGDPAGDGYPEASLPAFMIESIKNA